VVLTGISIQANVQICHRPVNTVLESQEEEGSSSESSEESPDETELAPKGAAAITKRPVGSESSPTEERDAASEK
jgi:hypothetical protein